MAQFSAVVALGTLSAVSAHVTVPSTAVTLKIGPARTAVAKSTAASATIAATTSATGVSTTRRAVACDMAFLATLVAFSAFASGALARAIARDVSGSATFVALLLSRLGRTFEALVA